MSKQKIDKLVAALAKKDEQINALKIQVMHARDITIHHNIKLLCSIIPHDENCQDILATAIDLLHAEEYKPVILPALNA
jgi:hypothetical protein